MNVQQDVNKPIQHRSKASFERILAATESMLQDDCFDNITISQILTRAKVSSGSFYARFASKEAMLPVLVDRHEKMRDEFLKRSLAPEQWKDIDLRKTIEKLVRLFCRFFEQKRGVIRALVMYYRAHPQRLNESKRGQLDSGYQMVVDLLLSHKPHFAQSVTRKSIQDVVAIMFASIRESTLFDCWPYEPTKNSSRLIKSLSRLVHASLTCPC